MKFAFFNAVAAAVILVALETLSGGRISFGPDQRLSIIAGVPLVRAAMRQQREREEAARRRL